MKGILIYHESNKVAEVQDLEAIKNSEPLLQQAYDDVVFCSDSPESVLVPANLYAHNSEKPMLNTVFGEAAYDYIFFNDRTEIRDVRNIHRLNADLAEGARNLFPGVRFVHSTSLQLSEIPQAGNTLKLMFYPHVMKLFLLREGQLLFVQYVKYTTATDAAYHLLNACQQFNIDPSDVNLRLMGMIDADSNLYKEIYKYFLHIGFEEAPYSDHSLEAVEYPLHFFSHLISMASCVS